MGELNKLGLAEARDALACRGCHLVELTDACLSAIDGAGALNAFVHHTPEIARTQAGAADARIKAGDAPAMCGLPIGIKDLFCTKGVPSQAGSRILEGFLPEYESTVSQNLFDTGAVMLGKLNMDEFAMGSSNETSRPTATSSTRGGVAMIEAPLTPGGSSGGSAACRVAADLCLGGDRNGYRRIDPPACRLYRHYRRTEADLWPVFALGHRCLCFSSLDQAGPDDQVRCGMRRSSASSDDAVTTRWIRPRPNWLCRISRRC